MPGTLIASKLANALVGDAALTPQADRMGRKATQGALSGVLSRYRAKYGGLWVGGRVTLTDESIAFAANAMNRAIQTGTLATAIPLATVTTVEDLPGFFTKIVRVNSAQGDLTFRCYGARTFSQRIRDAVAKAQGTSA